MTPRRGARAVDGTCRRVFQHVDALHVFLVYHPEVTTRHAVDDHERALAGIHRGHAAKLVAVGRVWRRRAGDGEAAHLALQGGGYGRAAKAVDEVGALDGCYGRGDTLLVQCAISHHHDVFQGLLVGAEHYVEHEVLARLYLLRGVTHIAHGELAIGVGGQGELTVDVGDGTRGCAWHGHSGANEGLAVTVFHAAGDFHRRAGPKGGRTAHQHGENRKTGGMLI